MPVQEKNNPVKYAAKTALPPPLPKSTNRLIDDSVRSPWFLTRRNRASPSASYAASAYDNVADVNLKDGNVSVRKVKP